MSILKKCDLVLHFFVVLYNKLTRTINILVCHLSTNQKHRNHQFTLIQMNSVMNETWDLVVADELFSVSSYALALKAHQQGRPFVTLSTCIPTNLIKYHLSLGELLCKLYYLFSAQLAFSHRGVSFTVTTI